MGSDLLGHRARVEDDTVAVECWREQPSLRRWSMCWWEVMLGAAPTR